ncbi:MAG: hypothetical protein R2788_06885 [Saprospiraceae bacterium]
MLDPTSTSPGSIMPPYLGYWKTTLNVSQTAAKIRTCKRSVRLTQRATNK